MIKAMTYNTVARELGERPCADDFKQACEVLPDWKTTAYTPTEMAAHGVMHSSIIWAWARKESLGPELVVEFACQCAERVLHIFEEQFPDDDRPRKAIEAARKWADDPTKENARAAAVSYDAAYDAAVAVSYAAARAAAYAAATAIYAAYDARDAAYAARDAAYAAAADDSQNEEAAQIAILESITAQGETQ